MILQDVKVEKVDVADDPAHETADPEEFVPGEFNPNSPPVDYTVKGELIDGVEEGAPMLVHRYSRNGEEVEGVLHTTNIQLIKETPDGGTIVTTRNSVYKITEL